MSFTKQERRFLTAASASIFVPHNTQASLADIFHEDAGEETLQTLKQRDVLFFDERLPVYLVLHVPQCTEAELKSYLSRLLLKIEIWATNDLPSAEHSTSGPDNSRDLVYTANVEHNEDPIVLISQDEDDEKIFLNLVWEVEAILNRPQLRLHDVNLTFVPIALVPPTEEAKSDEIYLDPFKPQVDNLFEPLRATKGFKEHVPYLPLSRLRSVPPIIPKDDHTFHIRSIRSQPFPTVLAFATRLKFSKPSADAMSLLLLAILDIDMTPSIEVRGHITRAQATLANGIVAPYVDDMLPMECRSRDSMCFLYRLDRNKGVEDGFDIGHSIHIDTLDIAVQLQLEISDVCRPSINVYWSTNVDFMQHGRHTPNHSGSLSQQPFHKEPSVDGRTHEQSYSLGMSLQPVSHPTSHGTVTISFTADTKPANVGVPFLWQVLIVNRTNKATKLAIIPLPRMQKPTSQAQQYAKRHATRSSIGSIQLEKNGRERLQSDIAQAVMDENIVYAVQHSGAIPPETDVMSLTPELRIGPLGPGQCHEAEIKLVAFKSGAFTLDAVRVVDLVKEVEQGYGTPGVIMDIRELPDVIVEDGSD